MVYGAQNQVTLTWLGFFTLGRSISDMKRAQATPLPHSPALPSTCWECGPIGCTRRCNAYRSQRARSNRKRVYDRVNATRDGSWFTSSEITKAQATRSSNHERRSDAPCRSLQRIGGMRTATAEQHHEAAYPRTAHHGSCRGAYSAPDSDLATRSPRLGSACALAYCPGVKPKRCRSSRVKCA